MSGGNWNYQDVTYDSVSPNDLEEILKALRKLWHIIDWCESNDSIYDEENAKELYQIIKDLGDDIFKKHGK